MKIPDLPNSNNKIRDMRVINLYVSEGLTIREIASLCNISTSTVNRIVYRNASDIKLSRDYAKVQRVAHIARLRRRYPETIGKKSTLDILEADRKEYEGDKSSVSVGVGVTVNIMPVIKVDSQPLEFDIGSTRVAENT